jgi:hypothetical protein
MSKIREVVAAASPEHLIATLPATRSEVWPEGAEDTGGVVQFRRVPFPVVHKYIVPSRVTKSWTVRTVPFNKIRATQHEVTDRGLLRFLLNPPRRQEDLPLVLHLLPSDIYEVQDGHHRLVAAFLRGRTSTKVKVAGPVNTQEDKNTWK